MLRVAIVGAGSMGRQHAAAVRKLASRATLVAVADADETQARALATGNGVAVHGRLEEMLEREKPDAVHICTSPASHVALARTILEAGSHVYVEKPFAPSTRDAQGILSLAERRQRVAWAGHQLLYEGPTRQSAALVRRIGQLRHVESFFSFRPAKRQDGRPAPSAIDQFYDILPHPVYLLVHFLSQAAPAGTIGMAGIHADLRGAVTALVTSGSVTGTLTVTLEGRPVQSFVRLVGTRGTLTLDYVRGIVLSSIGTGSTIEKIIDPYRQAWRLAAGTTGALINRFVGSRSYPGLAEAFTAFYDRIERGTPGLVTPDQIVRTSEICDAVRSAMETRERQITPPAAPARAATVAITGGTGLLGKAVVRAALRRGEVPLVVSRRAPAVWDRTAGVHYLTADLAAGLTLPGGLKAVIHCAAETSGGWDAHQRNSIDATAQVITAMGRAGVRDLVHVSSLAVVDDRAPEPLTEASPPERNPRARGAYVWGKLESEKLVIAAEQEGKIRARIVRPAALVDDQAFDPPGKLGRAIGGTFVAVGSPSSTIPICGVERTAEILVWAAACFDHCPPVMHAIDERSPTRRELVTRLLAVHPGDRVVWLYTPILYGLSFTLKIVQRVLRPTRTPLDVASAFMAPRCADDAPWLAAFRTDHGAAVAAGAR